MRWIRIYRVEGVDLHIKVAYLQDVSKGTFLCDGLLAVIKCNEYIFVSDTVFSPLASGLSVH